MNCLLKYLSTEAIDNCITCLNVDIDRVIFFGYSNTIIEEKENISIFLKEYCNCESKFISISNLKLQGVISLIEENINDSDNYYFDMTGSDGLTNVAFSNIAYKKNILMHVYDFENNQFINIDDDLGPLLNGLVLNKKEFSVEKYIKMVGGCIRHDQIKRNKSEFDLLTKSLVEIKNEYKDYWPSFVSTLQLFKRNYKNKHGAYTDNLLDILKIDVSKFYEIINELKKEGIILNTNSNNLKYEFEYASEDIKQTILEAGSILEKQVFEIIRKYSDDALIGVPLDWDGEITNDFVDVTNEIDVLFLKDYRLCFISCKDTTNFDKYYLYELETITRRFGSKYSKMLLVTTSNFTDNMQKRAELIGIELISFNDFKAKYCKDDF